ncbi:MAG TPA: site-2 protease family protein, partial [Acidimicrobiales bacterium]|nr:site-2 protease family protein [Acidimicrobiales bacterium]
MTVERQSPDRTTTGWRETLETDPLGLANRRRFDDEDQDHDVPPNPRSQRSDLLRLVVGVAVIIAIGFLAGAGETVLLVLLLVLCIVAHEFGHFIAAKTGRIKVTQFFVGF